jgi:hypothetical protein
MKTIIVVVLLLVASTAQADITLGGGSGPSDIYFPRSYGVPSVRQQMAQHNFNMGMNRFFNNLALQQQQQNFQQEQFMRQMQRQQQENDYLQMQLLRSQPQQAPQPFVIPDKVTSKQRRQLRALGVTGPIRVR